MLRLLTITCIILATSTELVSQVADRALAANKVMNEVYTKLAGISAVSYNFKREMRYYEDNYHAVQDAAVYVKFTKTNAAGFIFQGDDSTSRYVYNGMQTLRISEKDLTIDSATVKDKKQLESNSYLYNSFVMLKNLLPKVIEESAFSKSLSDTIMDNKIYFCVSFEMPGKYTASLGDILSYSKAGLRSTYHLIIDKTTYLPVHFITKLIHGTDERDFIAVSYSNVDTKPTEPLSESWTYAGYKGKYRQYIEPVKTPLVKTGTVVKDFRLPNYTSASIDSISLADYRGKIVLLDFWFKSCGPCMAAMPHYNELQTKFGTDKFQLLTINIEDSIDDIKYFYNKYQPGYKMLFNGMALFESFGLEGCPSALLLDSRGKVTDVSFGFDSKALEVKISKLLE